MLEFIPAQAGIHKVFKKMDSRPFGFAQSLP
jgi:hypothetical protein